MTPPPSSLSPPQSWERLLRTPHPRDHVVQLYTDEQFLGRAVAHFLGAGLRDGGAAVIIGTPAHVRVISDRLDTAGVEIPKAVRRGQLVIADAEQCLARFMKDGLPDRAAFLATVLPILETIRAEGYRNIRLFGEMVNLLWDHNLEATVQLEEMWNEVLADQGVSLLCAYRIDPFDVRAHRGVLHQISRCHSHLVPVDDYDRLDRAVERALGDTFGQGRTGATTAHRDPLPRRHVDARVGSRPVRGPQAVAQHRRHAPRADAAPLSRRLAGLGGQPTSASVHRAAGQGAV